MKMLQINLFDDDYEEKHFGLILIRVETASWKVHSILSCCMCQHPKPKKPY